MRWLAVGLPVIILSVWLLEAARGSGHRRPLTGDVVISEVAWGGTIASSADEWIELYNPSDMAVSLDGWLLNDGDGDVTIVISGTIPAQGFFVLERTDNNTISDRPAEQLFTGPLDNTADEHLTLHDNNGRLVDTANGDLGIWPGGSGSPGYLSMERLDPLAADYDDNWASNDGVHRNGLDAGGNPLNGSPGQPNAAWNRLPTPTTTPSTPPAVTLTPSVTPPGPTPTPSNTPVPTATGLPTTTASPTASPTPQAVLPSEILIDAVYYDGYEYLDADEAVRLYNSGEEAVQLGGWTISDAGGQTIVLPEGAGLEAGEGLWLTKGAQPFYRQWGMWPAYEAKDTAAGVSEMQGSWPGFSNTGDAVILRSPEGVVVDVLVYEEGILTQGWQGGPVIPYQAGGLFAEEGQVLYRRHDPLTGRPVPDSDRASDWAATMDDAVQGRRVFYPGWNTERFFLPAASAEPAELIIGVAPDNAYALLLSELSRARYSVQIEALTFEHLGVAEALAAAASRGVQVTLLLEGAPVGGLSDQERFVCQQLENAGGACWFMVRDDASYIQDRYRYLHAKYVIIDGERALISSENLSPRSFPDDEKTDGTGGHRGLLVVTDAPAILQRLQALFEDDLDMVNHRDLVRWSTADPLYGVPSPHFVPITVTGGTTYTVRYPIPLSFVGSDFVLLHAPENSLSNGAGFLALIAQAGVGDTILVQQLSERPHWGASDSIPATDPNPRLEALVAAARRGATVRLLLDGYYSDVEDPVSNRATCAYVEDIATREQLRLFCAQADPAGIGIHNKMILLELGGKGWLFVGSLNGTEQAHKGNREVVLQVQSDEAYAFLAAMFIGDWPHRTWLPVVSFHYQGPATHVLISEVLYDPPGIDDAEFIELVNPTPWPIDLSNWGLGDAVFPEEFEDLRRFPPGTILQSQQTLVVATTATAFRLRYGRNPDFEILDSDPAVPNLPDEPLWGDPGTYLQLGNSGDEVLLRDSDGHVIDAVIYGDSDFPGEIGCALVATGHSLERIPFWLDQNNCPANFRDWPIPSPGQLPVTGQ